MMCRSSRAVKQAVHALTLLGAEQAFQVRHLIWMKLAGVRPAEVRIVVVAEHEVDMFRVLRQKCAEAVDNRHRAVGKVIQRWLLGSGLIIGGVDEVTKLHPVRLGTAGALLFKASRQRKEVVEVAVQIGAD